MSQVKIKPVIKPHPTQPGLMISHQRYYQIKNAAKGMCRYHKSRRAATKGSLCLECAVKARERSRLEIGAVKRYNSLTYRLEQNV